MQFTFVNESQIRMPKKFIEEWTELMILELRRQKARGVRSRLRAQTQITVVFLDAAKARKLNRQFRKRDYATDILSFSGEGLDLGELVLCPTVLRRQSLEHGLSFRQELAYMITHGFLHLLGYDHELDRKQAEAMFSLQDKIFALVLRKRFVDFHL